MKRIDVDMGEYFPTVTGELKYEVYDVLGAYLCIEVSGVGCVAHIGNVRHEREYIVGLIEYLRNEVAPWLRERFGKIISTCDINDKGTYRFLEAVGFKMETIVIGVL